MADMSELWSAYADLGEAELQRKTEAFWRELNRMLPFYLPHHRWPRNSTQGFFVRNEHVWCSADGEAARVVL